MRRYTITTQAQEDESLDKVRVYIGESQKSDELHTVENLVYEGEIADYDFEGYEQGTVYYVGLEYYSDENKVLRPKFPKKLVPYTDLGPWNTISNPFAMGDASFGYLEMQKIAQENKLYMSNFKQVFDKLNVVNGNTTLNQVTIQSSDIIKELSPVCINGKLEMYFTINDNFYFFGNKAQYLAVYNAVKNVADEEKTITVGDFKWKLCIRYLDDYLKFIQLRLNSKQYVVGASYSAFARQYSHFCNPSISGTESYSLVTLFPTVEFTCFENAENEALMSVQANTTILGPDYEHKVNVVAGNVNVGGYYRNPFYFAYAGEA